MYYNLALLNFEKINYLQNNNNFLKFINKI